MQVSSWGHLRDEFAFGHDPWEQKGPEYTTGNVDI